MILISGYYGFDNLGDEAILSVLCADLLALGISGEDIVVLSNNPEQTAERLKVTAIGRYDLREIWKRLGKARAFISGGGSLLQDVTSKRSIPYYLGLVELALIRQVPVIMYGQGLGPVRNDLLRSWVKRAFKACQVCSVRDLESMRFLTSLGVSAKKIELYADPVFQNELISRQAPKAARILFNLRPYLGWEEQQDIWHELVLLWQSWDLEVEFISLGPGDLQMAETLIQRGLSFNIHANLDLDSLEEVFRGAQLCVSMRLHGLIFSVLHDCMAIGINYDPKVVAICNQLRLPFWQIDSLGNLGLGLEEILQDLETYESQYRRSLGELRTVALKNRAMLARVLG